MYNAFIVKSILVLLQYDLEEDVTHLETADPRCFYLIKTRGGTYWLESTQFPGNIYFKPFVEITVPRRTITRM